MAEHRNTPRHRVLKAGTIKFGGAAINCMVRNLSDAGAMLEVTKPVEVPEEFTLALPAEGTIQVFVMVPHPVEDLGANARDIH